MNSLNLISKFSFVGLLVFVTGTMLGCGGGSADYEFPEAKQEVTQLQAFRDTVKSYADSGQLDSGAELLVEEVDQLADAGVSNVSEVKAKVQELVASKSSAETKKIANEILAMLPEKAAAPAAE
ncbi:MAG: hypothetical protein HUJ26_13040 [Planctomycetaceae bacterium]|nr:hypothetical protein [Planctomycetaceae bacterium]